MKRNREKMSVLDIEIKKVRTFEELKRDNDSELPNGILGYVKDRFDSEITELYCPGIYIFPISVSGELYREFLLKDWVSCEYGCYEHNFEFEGETYLLLLENND